MSLHVVDDEERSDRRATPMRPSDSGVAQASASLALLDDVRRHRLPRAALHLPPPGQERGPFYYSDRFLVRRQPIIPRRLRTRARDCSLFFGIDAK
jgi:hypothetical protein